MSKDTKIVERLGQEIGEEIEIQDEPPRGSPEYALILDALESPAKSNTRYDPTNSSFGRMAETCVSADGIHPTSKVAIVDSNGRVTRLYLNNTQGDELPRSLFELENLQVLFIYQSEFRTIPPDIGKLRRLRGLMVFTNTRLLTVSPELTRLPDLSDVEFKHVRRLSTPPSKIAGQGIDAIRNYFESLEKAKDVDYLYEAKMVLVGRGFAGKTSLVRKLTNPRYSLEDKIPSTEGIDIQTWDLEMPLKRANKFRFNIWDFGGQEKYDATHQFFITERTVYLFVTEARQESNYLDFDYWLNIVQMLGDNSPVIVVQNKIDKRKRSLPTARYRAQFPNILDFVDVSCADGREETITKLVGCIKQAVAKLPQVGDKLPGEWVSVRKELEALDSDHITYEAYCGICAGHGISEDRSAHLCRYFHDLGVIVHYHRDPLLKKMVIVNPDWAVDGVYDVLDAPTIEENHGRFTTSDLARIWTEEKYVDRHPELLALMKNYQFCFELPATGTYIAPELLAANPVRYKPIRGATRLTFIYRYEFMPAGLITRLIVKIHRLIDGEKFWRSGVVVKHEGARAAIVEDDATRTIRIDIEGDDTKRDLLAIIRKAFGDIYADFNSKIEYEELTPCICSRCEAHIDEDEDHHLFKWRTLRKYAWNKIPTIRCEATLAKVSVEQLVGNVADEPDLLGEDLGFLGARHVCPEDQQDPAPPSSVGHTATGTTPAPVWQKVTAVVVGIVILLLVLTLAVYLPNPTDFQVWVFRVVLALASGAFAAIIPGFIEVKIRKSVLAGGALAVFVIVYFTNPPTLISNRDVNADDPVVIEDTSTDSTSPGSAEP